jgi:hypothetical protein
MKNVYKFDIEPWNNFEFEDTQVVRRILRRRHGTSSQNTAKKAGRLILNRMINCKTVAISWHKTADWEWSAR